MRSIIVDQGDDPTSLAAASYAGREEEVIFPSQSLLISPLGMKGFDSVIHGSASPLFGMATVPVTHMLQIIDAKTSVTARLEKGLRFAQGLRSSVFATSFAMAA